MGVYRSRDIQRFVRRLRGATRQAQFMVWLGLALAAALPPAILALPSENVRYFISDALEGYYPYVWKLPLTLALLCAAAALAALALPLRALLDLHRDFVHGNLISGNLLLTALGEDAYQRLPALGREVGTTAWLRNAVLFRPAQSMRGRLRHLLRTYADCCRNLGLQPWPRCWLRTAAIAGLLVMLVPWAGSLYYRVMFYTPQTDPAVWLQNSPLLWKGFAIAALTGMPLSMAYTNLMTATLGLGLLDALETWDDESYEGAEEAAEEYAVAGDGWG
jgi:hypothetical protein